MASVKDVMEARAKAEKAVAGLIDELTGVYLGLGSRTGVCELCQIYGDALERIAHLDDGVLYHGTEHALRHVTQVAQTALVYGDNIQQKTNEVENTPGMPSNAGCNLPVSIDMMENIVGRHDKSVPIRVEKGDGDE